ncbi:MAG: polysaccharide biosynthesis/export family protein [Acidaminococcaceae bacterium]|nr:polysaccharide biosynthesis/export family protein [Acidaminococcaceae bacterium]MBR2183050.1 polysaccharide biosynthesis/export family protein [Acidaminococcaceae bacterium]
MKKTIAALLLGAALTLTNVAAAEEYIMTPGDQLQIYVLGHPDISSTRANTDSAYTVRPDGKLNFPLVGEIDINGLTVYEFTQLLTKELSEYIINPKITVNVAKLGTTRVFVMGEVSKQGMYELSKSHRVLDALGAAGGFTQKAAKKNIYLVRNVGTPEENVQKINILNYMKKGDTSQNVVLQEGDCLFLTSNHKITLADVLLLANRATDTWYDVKYIKDH